MLIGYTPKNWITHPTIALQGGSWLTQDQGVGCVDGEPMRAARYQAAAQTTLTMTLPSPVSVGITAILGIRGANAGTAVSVSSGGKTSIGTLVQFPDGTVGAFLRLTGASASNSVVFKLPAGTLDIGELVALPVVEIEHTPDWQVERIDPMEVTRTRGASRVGLRRRPWRTMNAGFQPQRIDTVRGERLPGGMDWEQLAETMLGDARIIAAPRYATSAELNRTAIYGTARMSAISHLVGDWYGSGITVEELPAS